MGDNDARAKLKEHKGNNKKMMTEWKRCNKQEHITRELMEWKMKTNKDEGK